MIGIYKITSPTGKIYIGQSIDIERRWNEYKKLSCSQSKKLYNSLKKYKPENHLFEILEECNVDELNSKEEHYILLHNSHINGLNIKLASKPSWTGKKRPEHSKMLKENGCGFQYTRTEEHKNKIKNGNLGKVLTEKNKNEISNRFKNTIYINNGDICKRIKKDQPIPEGWVQGRITKRSKSLINNSSK